MTQETLNEILHLHKLWLKGDKKGEQAELISLDLRYTDLHGIDLSYADLSYSNLSHANLSMTNLSYTDLRGAYLCGTDLTGANLQNANLAYNVCFAGAKGIPVYQAIRGFGSRNSALTLLAVGEREEWRWFTGCFDGSEEELRKAVQEKYGDSKEGKGYCLAIDYLLAQAENNIVTETLNSPN